VWLSPEAIATWEPAHVGTRGGQPKYSNLAIETSLTLRLLFHLPLRQTEGFLTSVFGIMGLDLSVPDHTTLSRRGQSLDLALRRVRTGKRLHLVVDSTGLSIVGEGEWAAAKHGGPGKRGWKKLHLGVDRSGHIIAQALTGATADDALTGIALIEALAFPRLTSLRHVSPKALPRPWAPSATLQTYANLIEELYSGRCRARCHRPAIIQLFDVLSCRPP